MERQGSRAASSVEILQRMPNYKLLAMQFRTANGGVALRKVRERTPTYLDVTSAKSARIGHMSSRAFAYWKKGQRFILVMRKWRKGCRASVQ